MDTELKVSGEPTCTRATPRLKFIQATALTLLVAAGVINYIDRATLAVANPMIR